MEDRAISTTTLSPSSPVLAETSPYLEVTGGRKLSGTVQVSGAKNSALVVLAGALLCNGTSRLRNVPLLADVDGLGEILGCIGVKVKREGDAVIVDASALSSTAPPYELVNRLRASFFAIGPLLARLGVVQMPLPGGCNIGARPVDLHVRGLRALGAHVLIEHGVVHATVPGSRKRLQGARFYMDCPSVGATETLMMAATLAEGETILENAAQEPEVVDLANFLRAMGAKIRGAGSNTIVINGVDRLHPADYAIVPDRIEAGTFLLAGAITGSEICVVPGITDHLSAVIAKLEEMGCSVVQEGANQLVTKPRGPLRGSDIRTLPYPGFPTDMQAQFMALMTVAEGDSVLTETVFENRMQHVAELQRMGADIRLQGNTAIIRGVPRLSGAPVLSTDLRASAALIIAGLAADGVTQVRGLHHLDRGYENIEAKLRGLGADIRRVTPA